jgi:copper chaperone CopZ
MKGFDFMSIVKKTFAMEDLDCANCARKIQDAIVKIDGVENCEINFMLQKMTLEYDADNQDKLFKAIKKCVKKVEPDCSVIFG